MAREKHKRRETPNTGWFLVSRCTGNRAVKILPLGIAPERPANTAMFDITCLVHGRSPEALDTCTSLSVLVFVDGRTPPETSRSQAAARATAILGAAQ